MWSLTVYEVCCSRVEVMEQKVNVMLRKWLGAPKMLTSVALYSKSGVLQLPLKSIVEEYKCSKVRLAMMMKCSPDEVIAGSVHQVSSGRRWRAEEATERAVSAAQFREILGAVRQNRAGIGCGRPSRWWSSASTKERRELAVTEVRREEEEARRVKAVQQSHQGAWSRWEEIEPIQVSWAKLLRWQEGRVKFLLGATYDVLCTPANLARWGLAPDLGCVECGAARATLGHILSSCPVALRDGRYTWRHNRVLAVLARGVEEVLKAKPANDRKDGVLFVGEGANGKLGRPYGKVTKRKRESKIDDWCVQADFGGTRSVPAEICESEQRPDLVIWSTKARRVILAELTVAWEAGVQKAHSRKEGKYTELAAQCRLAGWDTQLYPIEIGCRGFLSRGFGRFVRCGLQAGPRGQRRLGESLSEEAQLASGWILRNFAKGPTGCHFPGWSRERR
jgi:hypothetical protein